MAFTWAHFHIILNCSALFVSLALVGLSPAILYLTGHGMQWMNKAWPGGQYYEWYRGPSWDMDTKHEVGLVYDSATEYLLLAAGAVGIITGLVGIVGFFLARQTSKPSAQKATLYLQILPSTIAFVMTFIAFVFTQVIYDTDNHGFCDWTIGYTPGYVFNCTREQAACGIVGYFKYPQPSEMQSWFDTKRLICGETQTGRHLMAPLFVAGTLFFAFAVGKFFVEKRESRFVESADERVERLERE